MTRAPQMRIKLDYWDDEFNCEIYDMQSNVLFPKHGSDVTPVDHS